MCVFARDLRPAPAAKELGSMFGGTWAGRSHQQQAPLQPALKRVGCVQLGRLWQSCFDQARLCMLLGQGEQCCSAGKGGGVTCGWPC